MYNSHTIGEFVKWDSEHMQVRCVNMMDDFYNFSNGITSQFCISTSSFYQLHSVTYNGNRSESVCRGDHVPCLSSVCSVNARMIHSITLHNGALYIQCRHSSQSSSSIINDDTYDIIMTFTAINLHFFFGSNIIVERVSWKLETKNFLTEMKTEQNLWWKFFFRQIFFLWYKSLMS